MKRSCRSKARRWPEESRKNDNPGYSLRREPLGILSPEWNHCLQKGVRRLWQPAVAQARANRNAGTNTATHQTMSQHKTAKPPDTQNAVASTGESGGGKRGGRKRSSRRGREAEK